MGTVVAGPQRSGMECLHKAALNKEVNALVSEAVLYFRRNGDTISTYTCGCFSRTKVLEHSLHQRIHSGAKKLQCHYVDK